MDLTEKMLSSELIYNGKILDLYRDKIELPDKKCATREYIAHRGAAAIIAFDENNDFLLVKQYRYPLHKAILEIPAGKLEKGEDPYPAAIRELEEETGYKAGKLVSLGAMHPTVGYSSEIIYLYLAVDLVKTNPHPDNDEFIDLVRVSEDKLCDMIKNGEITDSKTIAAYCKYKLINGKN